MRLLALILCLWVGSASAAELRVQTIDGQRSLFLSGRIELGDDAKFEKALREAKGNISTVAVNSPGGNLAGGMALGRAIRSAKLATHVPGTNVCASACLFVLAGGVVRSANQAAQIGVHIATMMRSEKYIDALRDVLLERSLSLDDRIRLIVEVNEQMVTAISFEQARYLQEMGISLRLTLPPKNVSQG